MSRHSLVALAAAGSLAFFCGACSTPAETPAAATATPAPAALEAAKAGSAVADAAKQASAVHIKGTISEGGGAKLDVQLNKDTASGTVVKDGLEVPALRVGGKYYFRFTESLVKKAGIPASAAKQITGKWVPSTSKLGEGMGEAFKAFLDYKTFTDNTVGRLATVDFTGGDPTTVGDTQALNFSTAEGTATVAAAEPHYLLRMQEPKSGTLEFSDWNKPTEIKEPSAAEIYRGPGA